ncbi:hypothetical protein M9H77_31581 [Catharanthus roseus]|uniref:Uncharacterized protein n=1 Tax=Catharanthus roseus TaxID=4058 RepID=A0ACC0A1D4_CATRO|nr:hypothetical protein M9H77_31581 [Catharanthus roseus]
MKHGVDDEEEEVQVKRRGPYGTKKCGCPFKLKGEQMTTCENYKTNGEQLRQTEQFRKSHVPPRNILRFFREQNVGCAVSAHKVYNVIAKIKKNRMQWRNTVEEVLCLSAQGGYMWLHSLHHSKMSPLGRMPQAARKTGHLIATLEH